MKRRYILTMAGILLTFALLTGCGPAANGGTQAGGNASDSGSTQREEELQAEIDSLREELDALKNTQGSQETSGTDGASSTGTSDNTQKQSSQNSSAGEQTSSGTQISMEEAMQIALDRVPGATEQNISINLERDDGWLLYEGDILYNRMEYEFEIDAQSGTMLKWEEEAW